MSFLTITTTDLVNDIKRLGVAPTGTFNITDSQIVDFLNDELVSITTMMIENSGGDFFVEYVDTAMSSTVNTVDIPDRAINSGIKDVFLLNTTSGDLNMSALPLLSLRDIAYSSTSPFNYGYNSTTSPGYYIENNQIKMWPESAFSGKTVRVYYYIRPGKLIETTDGGKITNIDLTTNVVTLDNIPSTWSALPVVDIISQNQPYTYRLYDQTVLSKTTNTLTFSDASSFLIGDYIALSGYSQVPQIPLDTYKLLTYGTLSQIMSAIGDDGGYQRIMQKYQQVYNTFLKSLEPRTGDSVKKVTSGNNIINASRN